MAEETVVPLGAKKQITVRKYNGTTLVDIREFYSDKKTGELKPGKKGISLTVDLWKKLTDSKSEIDEAIESLEGENEKKREQPAKEETTKNSNSEESSETDERPTKKLKIENSAENELSEE